MLDNQIYSNAPQQSKTFGVKEIVDQAQLAVASTFPNPVWVCGEIQNFQKRGKFVYLQICEPKDQNSEKGTLSLSATIWPKALYTLETRYKIADIIADGMKVRLLCQVGLYRDRGQISLNILDVDPSFTKGALALAREQIIRELRASGHYDKNRKLSMPMFPLRIGLISAQGSRAKSDFIDQLSLYKFPGTVLFFDAKMQGELTPTDVQKAISYLQTQRLDVLVITRGGGSQADLRWFDHRDIALAIANCPVPVVAAIGHHEDVCVAEFVCWQREKTPTAAADFFIDRLNQAKKRMSDFGQQIARIVDIGLDRQRERITNLRQMLVNVTSQRIDFVQNRLTQVVTRLINTCALHQKTLENKLSLMVERMFSVTTASLIQKYHSTMALEGRLQALDPKPWMGKGWTQIRRKNGATVKSIHDIERNESIDMRLIDGTLSAIVTEKR